MARNLKWLLIVAGVVALFYWKILFTGQFSIVEDWEAANQGYAWHQFAVRSIQDGVPPLWDPYTFSGRSHIGEMQPGLFYPLKLLLYLWPLGESGMLSTRLFHQYFVLAHLLAAVFMFFFALDAGVQSRFAAMIAGICFSLGGFVASAGGSQLWDSAIWLPLILLLLLRALRAEVWNRRLLYACFAGLALAMTVLAGGLHVAIMDTIAVVTAAAFFVFHERENVADRASLYTRSVHAAAVVGMIGTVTFAGAAVQFLPSIEYAPLAVRWGGGTALEKIPYYSLTESHFQAPQAVLAFLLGSAPIGTAEYSPYLGVLPLFLALLGAYCYRRKPWVKYTAALAILSFIYCLGPFSLLYGVLYLVPFLDAAREAGRFIYLTHFGMALLAGFGTQTLLDAEASSGPFLQKLTRVLGVLTVGLFFAVLIPTLYGKPDVNEWYFVSLLFFMASWGILTYVARRNCNRIAKLLLVSLILWDLHAFNWVVHNSAEDRRSGRDYLEQLLAARPLADFFHSQGDLFRVHVLGEPPTFINLGGIFQVQTTWGQAATSLTGYSDFAYISPKGLSLLNVRYVMVPDENPDEKQEGRLVFSHARWRVHERVSYCPRAWVVHRTLIEPSSNRVRQQIENVNFDPLQMAFVSEPLEAPLEETGGSLEAVAFRNYQADRLELEVEATANGLLVLSEMHYPGWKATINGAPSRIYKVNGFLRGVLISSGKSRVVMEYRPGSVLVGGFVSLLTVLTSFAFSAFVFRKNRIRGRA